MSETVTNHVMLLGAGIDLSRPAEPQMTVPGAERADAVLSYYYTNTDAFRSRDARIVCTGGYGLLAAGAEAPADKKYREGTMAADHLVRHGVPPGIIEVEDESTSTVRNFANCIDQGLIVPADYSADRPLGVATHPEHFLRGKLIAGHVGFAPDALVPVPVKGEESRARELVLRGLYGLYLFGAKDTHTARRREDALARTLRRSV